MPNARKLKPMKYKIDKISIILEVERNGLRLKTENENWFIPNQTVAETKKITEINFKIVKNHFKNKIGQQITETDLDNVCFKIVLHYFQLYNHWRSIYKREIKRDLTFLSKDFENADTYYFIIDYFQKKYPENYVDKCEIMLEIGKDQLQEYLIRKAQYENR